MGECPVTIGFLDLTPTRHTPPTVVCTLAGRKERKAKTMKKGLGPKVTEQRWVENCLFFSEYYLRSGFLSGPRPSIELALWWRNARMVMALMTAALADVEGRVKNSPSSWGIGDAPPACGVGKRVGLFAQNG